MTGGVEFVGPPAPPSRSAVRKATFITIAGVLAIVGALTGGYYFAMRPVPLKIAVGPPNSDDVRVVQTLTQAFSQNHSYVRLRPVQTEGATESASALADGRVDLAIIRGDLEVPKNAQAGSRPQPRTAARRPSSPSIRRKRSHRTTRLMRPRKFPPAPSAARPTVPTTR